MITLHFKKLFSQKNENQMSGAANAGEKQNSANAGETRKARIYNLIIVDESGSMISIAHPTVDGVNETIGAIRAAQESYSATQEHFLSLVTFDSGGERDNVRTLLDRVPIAQVEPFSSYNPCGCTPLNDAVGQSLTTLHNAIKDDRDATGAVTIVTDGLENDSHQWTQAGVRALIEQLKEKGWTFSYMGSDHDVAAASASLSIDCHVEFGHDSLGSTSGWQRESSAREAYYRKMNAEYEQGANEMAEEQWLQRKRQMAKEYYSERVTPYNVGRLEPHEVFVFGSNVQGAHDGGAAAVAVNRFGAVRGQAEGLQGQSYAIPTVGVSLSDLGRAVQRFAAFAASHPERRFLVTRIGCGNAGWSPRNVAPLFADCIRLENVALPADFWQALGLTM